MKYTFQFGDSEKSDKQVLETRSGESQRHIILKALGHLLYHDRHPQIERRVTDNKRDYRPDVVAFNAEGAISLWIDCGQIALRKVDDLTRRLQDADLIIIKPTQAEMEAYAREATKKVRRVERVQFLGFDPDFVPALIAEMGHLNTVQWQREGALLTVTLNGNPHTTTLWRWDHSLARSIPSL